MLKIVDKYMRSTVVLAIDTVTSLIASALVILFSYVVLDRVPGGNSFISIWLIGAFFASLFSFYVTGVYRLVIRFSTLRELSKLCLAVFIKDLLLAFVAGIYDMLTVRLLLVFLIVDFLITISGLLLVRVAMLSIYWVMRHRKYGDPDLNKVLVYGINEKSVATVTRLRNSTHYNVVGFLIPYEEGVRREHLLAGKQICFFESADDLRRLRKHFGLSGILFVHNSDARKEQTNLIPLCREVGLKMFIAPSIDEMTDGKFSNAIRKIKIEDLLGRPEINISMKEIRENFARKTILVTGAAGSIGSELCRQLAVLGVKQLVMFDNAETPLHNVRLEFEEKFPSLYFTPVIGDVRHKERLDYIFRKYQPDIVFHAAAYKHVPLMEENPCEAVRANVRGSMNVADKCVEYNVEKMVMVSTDKAVNPTNIMGCTKRLAEIYVQSLGLAIEKGEIKGRTTFVTTRFGNVLGSNGSVIPRFQEQIEKGGPVTVTDPEIRRFFMTIPEACRLVMEAATMATGTQIFVFDMGTPMKIADLASRMITLAGFEPDVDIKIEYTGLRPGEKLYEEVLATKENTIPTNHERIYVAKVREYPYSQAKETMIELDEMAMNVDIDNMVIKMKATVPEFVSKHSIYEKFDNLNKD